MNIKSRKLFAILVIAAMVLTMLPLTGFAASNNSVDRVVQVSADHVFTDVTAPILRIEERSAGEFSTSESFRLTLTNAKFLPGFTAGAGDITILTNTIAEVTIGPDDAFGDVSGRNYFLFPLVTEVTGEGNVQVTIDGRDSAVSSGTLTYAVSAPGRTITSISRVVSFARTASLGDIQIDETRINALGSAAGQTIKIKLPPKFQWVEPTGGWDYAIPANVQFSGGLDGAITAVTGWGERTLELTFSPNPTTRAARGSIFLKGLWVRADRDAPFGDVVADFDGTNVTDQELVIAKYTSYGIEAKVAKVEEAVAGRYDNRTAKITIEENIPNSLVSNRELTVVLPPWVKIVDVVSLKGWNGLDEDDLRYAANKNEIYFMIPSLTPADADRRSRYEFRLDLSVEGDQSGEIVAEFFGAGMEMQELVIASAVAPVTATVGATDLKIGVQNQPAPDIIITETAKTKIDRDTLVYEEASGNAQHLTVSLPSGITFSGTPKVEVTEGNIELNVAYVDGGTTLVIPVKSTSTRPSTIKISDVKLTLDRTVPEGAFHANIGGGAIVKNFKTRATLTDAVNFNKNRVVRFHFANVITPAPGEIRATTTFTIGSMDYTVVEAGLAVEKTMDVAPYIKDGRTYLPVRYVADALGVTPGNILWDAATQTVTIFKGDRIVQMVIGSRNLLVNGVNITMDVPAETVDGRTMLPVRWVAQALGATITWDAAAQTVTVTQ